MTDARTIEVEVRGSLPKEDFERLQAFFDGLGIEPRKKHRIFVDYSTFLPGGVRERDKDIRIRITNGVPEIIVKLGGWGGSESRKELSVKTEQGSFDTLAETFAALGYKKGILCERNTLAYDYKGIEFALVEVPGHSYYFEAEKMATATEDSEALTTEINSVCTELGLIPFTNEEFFSYIELLNKDGNNVYDFDEVGPGYFNKTYGL